MKKILLVILISFSLVSSCTKPDVIVANNIEFTMGRGLPIIEVKINGIPAKLLVDSGAMTSVINSSKANEYNFDYMVLEGYSMTGVSGTVSETGLVSRARTTSIDGGYMPIRYRSINLDLLQDRLGIIGIVGSDYLNTHGYIINYREKMLKK